MSSTPRINTSTAGATLSLVTFPNNPFRKCDLASQESIKEFVKQFQAQESKCDVLINNAGLMKCRRTVTAEGIESQLGVNHMGHYLLTDLLRQSLAQAGAGR